MIKIYNTLFLLIITIMINSCSDYPCTAASLQFGLVGFSDTEADTIVIKRFAKNSPSLIDSIPIGHISFERKNDTLQMVAFPGNASLQSEYDYEIYFPQPGISLRVTEINEEQRHLKKKGIFSTTKEGCENHISSYKLDGQVKTVPLFNETYFTK